MEVVFGPSSQLAHTLVAFITTDFVVLGVGAFCRRERFAVEATGTSMTWRLTALVPCEILLGDHHGLNTLERSLRNCSHRRHVGDPPPHPLTLFRHSRRKETESNCAAIEVPFGQSILTLRLTAIKG